MALLKLLLFGEKNRANNLLSVQAQANFTCNKVKLIDTGKQQPHQYSNESVGGDGKDDRLCHFNPLNNGQYGPVQYFNIMRFK